MGILSRLWREWRPTRRVDAAAQPASPLPVPQSPRELLAQRVRPLCAQGHAVTAAKAWTASTYEPIDAADALWMLREVVAPILEACIAKRDTASGCEVERLAYGRLIKVFELPAHYEAGFAVLDPLMRRLGAQSHVAQEPQQRAMGAARLLFFVHNATTEMAHIPLLCDVLEAYLAAHPQQGPSLGIGGWFGDAYAPRIGQLAQRWGVQLAAVPSPESSSVAYDATARLVLEGCFDRVVVVAAPTGISYLSGILGPAQLAWYSMKFELDSFAGLAHRCSFVASDAARARSQATTWRRAPPFLSRPIEPRPSGAAAPALARARTFDLLFFTVNREHKIRHPQFLEAVSRVLQAVPDSCFLWTGRERLADIDAFFVRRGLSERIIFAGWVNPDDLLAASGVFLDTPVLSGTVAAHAAVLGVPVVTWARAQSWVNAFVPLLEADRACGAVPLAVADAMQNLSNAGASLECDTLEEYVAMATRLSSDKAFASLYTGALGSFARHYFYDRERWAAQHLANLSAGLDGPSLSA